MNHHTASRDPDALATLETRFALKVVAHLHDQSEDVSPAIAERLRFAREQALARAKGTPLASAGLAPVFAGSGSWNPMPGSKSEHWRLFLSLFVPAAALLVGLMLIQAYHSENEIVITAEIDAALLADDLPPEAYRDSAFVEYLRNPVVE